MKNLVRRTFAVTLALCFILAFSFSAGAVDAIGDVIGTLDKSESGNLIEYDYINKTTRTIPLDSIPDYASMTKTTYELEGMRSELARLAEMSTSMSMNAGDIASPNYRDPTKPFVQTPPKVNGVPVDPYSGVVLIQMRMIVDGREDTLFTGRGTGFLVAPDVIVTAGHCMDVDQLEGAAVYTPAYISEMRIYPYTHNRTMTPWTYAEDYVYPASWICYDYSSALRDETKDEKEHDWCVIKLQQPITDAYNFACSVNTYEILGRDVSISGYPKCIDENCMDENCSSKNGYQVTSRGMVSNISDYYISYSNNSGKGGSGSPVYSTQTRICYAIMTYGSVDYNIGNRITVPVYNAISYYINQ